MGGLNTSLSKVYIIVMTTYQPHVHNEYGYSVVRVTFSFLPASFPSELKKA